MAQLAVSLLGSPHATYDGRPLAGVESNKVWALLAYLVLEADRPHQREALIGLLWPDQPEAAARHNLRQALTNLRQVLHDDAAAPPFLLITRTTIQFNSAADYYLDVAALSAKLAACEQHAHQQAENCAPCMRWRRQAVALYRGDFLDRFFVRDSLAFEEWALIKREGLHQRMLDALARLVTYYEQRSRYADATAAARRLLELDPLREETHRDLMRLLAAAGQRSAALSQYVRCRRLLQHDFGIEPEAATTALYHRIRTAAPDALVSAGRPAQATPHLTNLPTPPTPLIGRDREITILSAHLKDDHARLLTLTGPPGIGKTRLSLAVAAALQEEFDDGVWFVALAHIPDDALVGSTIAQALGVKELGGQSLVELLKNFLRDRQLLLVLDNFEHVLDAAPLVAELLAACPFLKTLVTSRAALRVRAERQFPVVPLALPDSTALSDVESVARAPAVALFLERAQAIMPEFGLRSENAETVAAICRLLDGMPLAIELAAARCLALPPKALLDQLDRRLAVLADGPRDLPERQQTLRAAIGWSYDLLDTSAQALFRRLGVFVGGWTLEAAERVANAPNALDRSTSDGLVLLLNQSLLRYQVEIDGQWRFAMLETIREYALEQLDACGELTAAQQQHATYYLELAEAAKLELMSSQVLQWLARLEREHGNLRATLARFGDIEEGEEAIRLSGAICQFWMWCGHLSEGRAWLHTALARSTSPNASRSAARAYALFGAGVLAFYQGDPIQAKEYGAASLDIYQRLNDRWGSIYAQGLIGHSVAGQGDLVHGIALLQESVSLSRDVGDRFQTAILLCQLAGWMLMHQGAKAHVRAMLTEALSLSREVGHPYLIATALRILGAAALEQPNERQADACFTESLSLCRELGDKLFIAVNLHRLVDLTRRQGDGKRAEQYQLEGHMLQRELGLDYHQLDALSFM